MDKVRVGIVSRYYDNYNYGGLLQAYALCNFISKHGYPVNQICYNRNNISLFLWCKIKIYNTVFFNRKYGNLGAFFKIISRNLALKKFEKKFVPHSRHVYRDSNIEKSLGKYDVFITGSDQVWNPDWFNIADRLDFVKNKYKFSYAASIAKDSLTDDVLQVFKNSLSTYNDVSVREEKAVELLSSVVPVPVKCVVDPTLLLGADDWDKICSDRLIDGHYAFCYFLGEDSVERQLAIEYSQKNNLTLVSFPHILGRYRQADLSLKGKQLYNVSPCDFISLIKYADIVFTDSFHCAVFANIYKKQFFVFDRVIKTSQSSRIKTLLSMFNTEDRFCDTAKKLTLEYLESEKEKYCFDDSEFKTKREFSINFLLNNLQKL